MTPSSSSTSSMASSSAISSKSSTPSMVIAHHPNYRILLIGEGNFSFARSLLAPLPEAQITQTAIASTKGTKKKQQKKGKGKNTKDKDKAGQSFRSGPSTFAHTLDATAILKPETIVATCFDPASDLLYKYPDAIENISILRKSNVRVYTKIDCTQFHCDKRFPQFQKVPFSLSLAHMRSQAPPRRRFHRIIFNFPHLGYGEKDSVKNIEQHRQFLHDFLLSVTKSRIVLPEDSFGQIHITLKTGEPYDSWKLPSIIQAIPQLRLHSCIPFTPFIYPYYEHRRTIGFDTELSSVANEDIQKGSRIYIITRARVREDSFEDLSDARWLNANQPSTSTVMHSSDDLEPEISFGSFDDSSFRQIDPVQEEENIITSALEKYQLSYPVDETSLRPHFNAKDLPRKLMKQLPLDPSTLFSFRKSTTVLVLNENSYHFSRLLLFHPLDRRLHSLHLQGPDGARLFVSPIVSYRNIFPMEDVEKNSAVLRSVGATVLPPIDLESSNDRESLEKLLPNPLLRIQRVFIFCPFLSSSESEMDTEMDMFLESLKWFPTSKFCTEETIITLLMYPSLESVFRTKFSTSFPTVPIAKCSLDAYWSPEDHDERLLALCYPLNTQYFENAITTESENISHITKKKSSDLLVNLPPPPKKRKTGGRINLHSVLFH